MSGAVFGRCRHFFRCLERTRHCRTSTVCTAAEEGSGQRLSDDEVRESVKTLQVLAARVAHDEDVALRLLKSSPGLPAMFRQAFDGSASKDCPPASVPPLTETPLRDVPGVDEIPPPTPAQRRRYFINNCLPFIGFGFFDNSVMLLVGDLVDAKVGLVFGISTMAAAAVGNTVSDLTGIWASGVIEAAAVVLGLPPSGLTSDQRGLLRMRVIKNSACAWGLIVGCFLGCFPLAYPDEWRLWKSRAEQEHERQTIE